MYLEPEEEKILDGEFGQGKALALKAVVKVGEALGAERLVRIKHAHVSGVSYKNIGDEGLEFLEELARSGARVSVPATMNPGGFDTALWPYMRVSADFIEKQNRIIKALSEIGVRPTLTCTPYLYEKVSYGDHIAWSESNAVLYANSVIGARTNRDGGPLALLEAISGRAPLAGLHLESNRRPQLIIDFGEVGSLVAERGLYHVAGLVVGRTAGDRVPLVRGLPLRRENVPEIKLFLAAVGAAGGTGLVLIEGISPERYEARDLERVPVDAKSLYETLEEYQGGLTESAVVVLGCPHLSLEEVMDVVSFFSDRGPARRRVILYTSREVYEAISGHVEKLRAKNLYVFADTCMVVSPLSMYAGREVVTDSGKAAFYLKAQGYKVVLKSRREALEYAAGGGE
ncbi:aconitase X catalytic domain-containing protein [Infirmifilum sp. SLHALR2]|nr:MAG: hypothetical protein B7L53_02425 [Thermofilum sp. NZ13]